MASIGSSRVFCGDSSDSFKTAFPELVHIALVGVFWSLDNIDQFANSLLDGAYFPECHVVFVGLQKNFIARIEMFLMGRNGFLELCFPWNEFVEDGIDFSGELCFCRRASIGVFGLEVILYTCRNCCNGLSDGVHSAFFKAHFNVSTNLSVCPFDLG